MIALLAHGMVTVAPGIGQAMDATVIIVVVVMAIGLVIAVLAGGPTRDSSMRA